MLTLLQPEAVDFAPDGALLVLQAGAVWQVDPASGAGTLRGTGVAGSGDIDIDGAGRLRSTAGGRLHVTDTGTWSMLGSVALQPGSFGPSALVHR